MKTLEIGQEIQTKIVAVTDDCVFLDLNTKSEGVLDIADVTDDQGKITVKEGDSIKVYFLGEQRGEMRFTTKISGDKADKSLLENAWKNSIPVEGHVEKEIKGGFEIKIGDSRAFCPYSQMGFRQKEEASFFIGKTLTFLIQEFKENGRNILVSNRAIEEEKYNEYKEGLKQKLKTGMTVKGKVLSLQSYGAFVEIEGFKALLPISEISRGRINDINEVLSVGQEIEASIIRIDWSTERISLSMKALLSDPWDTVSERYAPDDKVTGTISRISDFGLFITLEPGIDGLLHISEIEDADRKTNLRKLYKTGASISVAIKEIDQEGHRISLRPATTKKQDNSAEEFLAKQDDEAGETYNPFAALLKKK
ncbi:MAG: S1 RNA-binding domain-containing protein [Treponemataceae bacterium]|nr:S1 RNA-binding domain-containing protein [Treponemataceae bacterium]